MIFRSMLALVIIIASCIFSGCESNAGWNWETPPVVIPLTNGDKVYEHQFTNDGQYLVLLMGKHGDSGLAKPQYTYRVYDLSGKLIPDGIGHDGYLAPHVARQVPPMDRFGRGPKAPISRVASVIGTDARAFQQYRDEIVDTQLWPILKDSIGWICKSDYSRIVSLVDPEDPEGRFVSRYDSLYASTPDKRPDSGRRTLKCWDITNRNDIKLIWLIPLPVKNYDERGHSLRYKHLSSSLLLVPINSQEKYYLVNIDTGEFRTISLKKIGDMYEPMSNVVMDPAGRYLAIDSSLSQNVSILNIDGSSEHVDIIFGTNPGSSAVSPGGLFTREGYWSVHGVVFIEDKYLILRASAGIYSGRGFRFNFPARDVAYMEVFEMGTWRRLWRVKDDVEGHFSFSRDGTRMSIAFKDRVEIGPVQLDKPPGPPDEE